MIKANANPLKTGNVFAPIIGKSRVRVSGIAGSRRSKDVTRFSIFQH